MLEFFSQEGLSPTERAILIGVKMKTHLITPHFILGVMVLVIGSCDFSQDTGPRDLAIDAIFSAITSENPGAVVGVVKDGDIVHRAGYGSANLDYGISIDPQTIFDIASISKQFAAFSALLLVQDGKLDLDEDVRTYVPELPQFSETITSRHLIHHTSGIRDWVQSMAVGGVEYGDVISFEMILRMLRNQNTLNFEPGTDYAYSNTGYNLLTLVIERAAGQGFREFTNERIFQPLGMTNTHFSDNHNEIVPDRAESYVLTGTRGSIARYGNDAIFERRANQLTAMGSSSLHTTIDDFIKWMNNYQTGAVGGEELREQMLERGLLSNGDTLSYAYGLTISDYNNSPTFGHSGSWVGFRSNFIHLGEPGISIAVFCNFSTCDPQSRAFKIADLLMAAEQQIATQQARPEATTDPHQMTEVLDHYIGTFRNYELDTTYRLVVSDDHLVAYHWRARPTSLIPLGDDRFGFGTGWFGSGQGRITFDRDGNGEIQGFQFNDVRVRNLYFEKTGAL